MGWPRNLSALLPIICENISPRGILRRSSPLNKCRFYGYTGTRSVSTVQLPAHVVNEPTRPSRLGSSRTAYGIDLVTSALLNFKALNGDMLVPALFIVPHLSEDWPEETWGMKLGIVVSSIRRGSHYKRMRLDLESIGFDYGAQIRRGGYEELKSALLHYKDLNGDALVPATFIVPFESKWPEAMWGFKLGKRVESIARGKLFKFMRHELASIGLAYSILPNETCFSRFRVALQQYKHLHGNMLVPQIYVVPHDSVDFAEDSWGMKLGRIVCNVRRGRHFKYMKAELLGMGFDFNTQMPVYGYEALRGALLRYKELNGDLLINPLFTIPHGDGWAEEVWGMKLGVAVGNIRRGKMYKYMHDDLLLIGFHFRRKSNKRLLAEQLEAPNLSDILENSCII